MPLLRIKMATELQNECIDPIGHVALHGGGGGGGGSNENSVANCDKSVMKQKNDDSSDSDSVDPFAAICKKSQDTSCENSTSIKNWEDLATCLRALLPNEEGITYAVTNLAELSKEEFSGAPAYAFESTVRVNVNNADDAKKWLQSMMKHSNCTYRHSKGRNPGLKKVLYKVEMHCQHFRKPLTPLQLEQKASARKKNPRKVLMHDLRQKKTNCPSRLKFTVLVPPKKKRLASHPAILEVTYNHNHPIESAHALSFRPINPEVKETFFKLFRKGHSAASAFHWHETKLFLDGGEDQLLLADRATNPTKPDISRLYDEWRKTELGADNGKQLFDKLEMEVCSYNETNSGMGGQAKLQIYHNESSASDDTDSDFEGIEEPPKKPKKKKKRRSQPMVIAICSPLMCRVHQNVQQAGEMAFCDATSSLDRFNTSMFIVSTSSAIGGLPIGVIITSDEEQDTISRGLQLLKTVLPVNSFYGKGSSEGPSIVMTDDSSAERNALHMAWPKSRLLLCAFHFLQRNWTWLHNGTNQIHNDDR